MNSKKSLPYQPTNQTVVLLYHLANLASSISSQAVAATFAVSPSHLNEYLIVMNERAAEIQRLIQEFQQTGKKA